MISMSIRLHLMLLRTHLFRELLLKKDCINLHIILPMSELIKTEAIVLRKLDYGDTSKIAALYTEELGRISVIVKGGRTSKSKIGMIVDPLNIIQIVLYKKESREIQLLTQADIVLSPSLIKNELERIKYASAINELVYTLIPEHEPNHKIYRGVKRIFTLMNEKGESPKVLLIRFFLFFLKEIGYEIQLSHCADCRKDLSSEQELFFSYNKGVLCPVCKENHVISFDLNQELFNHLICLNGKKNGFQFDAKVLDRIIFFLEKYLSSNIEEFKGLKSLHIY
ncbi:MAG: DNA repair protein RecO [Flavobacterium sp.]|nr:DNA repair protein RecO [Flavobacterium sp.]